MTSTQLWNIPILPPFLSVNGFTYTSNLSITGNLTVTGNIGIGTAAPRDKLEVTGHIIPGTCNLYDLGTSNLRFRDLYLSGTSIDLGGMLITRNSNQDGIDIKTSSVATLQFKPPIKKLAYKQANCGIFLHNCIAFIDGNDNARAIGLNDVSRFGEVDVFSPAREITLPNKEKALEIVMLTNTTYVLGQTSNVYVLGENVYGQAALAAGASSAAITTLTTTAITNCKKIITAVDLSQDSLMFLTNDAKVYGAGIKQYGQLGDNTTSGNTLASGPLLTLGPGNTYGNPTTAVLDVVGVGSYDGTNRPQTYCALLSNGTVYCVGYGGNGQIGNGATSSVSLWTQVLTGVGTPLTNIVLIAGAGDDGATSFYAINSSGALYVWGYNGNGQLGVGDTTRRTYATLASTNVSKIWAFRATYASVIIQKTDGLFYGTGDNGKGQLGLGNTTDQHSFTLISSLSNKNIIELYPCSVVTNPHVFALSSNNKLYACGHNAQGQLGLYHITSPVSTFTEVPFYPSSKIKDCLPSYIFGSGGFTLVLTEDGQTYFTGRSSWGYAGSSTGRNMTAFCRNTSYLTGGAL